MKSAKNITAIFIFSITIFCGCRKEAVDVNADMTGSWEHDMYISPNNRGVVLTIASGQSEWYEYPQNSSNTGENGKIHRGKATIKDDRFRLRKIDLHIDEYPHYDSIGNYVMVLQGMKFFAAIYPVQYYTRVSNDTTYFSWAADGEDNSKMIINYKTATESTWSTVIFSRQENWDIRNHKSSGFLTGLWQATTYQWRMKTVNGNHSSQYTPIQTFTTN